MGGRGGSGSFIKGLFGGGGAGGGGRGGKVKPIPLDKIKNLTLQQAEARARTKNHEEMFIFDKNGKVVAGYRGNKNSVTFPAAELKVKGATVTHGHPKGDANFGGTFSFADVRNMAKSKWKEHRAAASGQGEHNYIMRRTNSARPKALERKLDRDEHKLRVKISSTYDSTHKSALKQGKTDQQASHIARQKAVGELHRYYKNTLPKYGYEYVTPKKEYPYQR